MAKFSTSARHNCNSTQQRIEKLQTTRNYFRNNYNRMNYPEYRKQDLASLFPKGCLNTEPLQNIDDLMARDRFDSTFPIMSLNGKCSSDFSFNRDITCIIRMKSLFFQNTVSVGYYYIIHSGRLLGGCNSADAPYLPGRSVYLTIGSYDAIIES